MQAIYAVAGAGMSAAWNRFEASARRTAEAPLDNIGEEAVERMRASMEFAVNLQVLRTADRMTQALLDIRA